MSGIRGEIATTDRELNRCRRLRAAKKPKAPGEAWEDRVWLLFKKMGFTAISKDRHCYIVLKDGHEKQIDVLAHDEHNAFVVQCTSSDKEGPVRARNNLEWFEGYQDHIRSAIYKEWGHLRLSLVSAVSSEEKAKADLTLADSLRRKNIFLWSSADIRYMEELCGHIGPLARYQIYSVLFAGKQQKSLARSYPALKGSISGRPYYSFLISAKDLLQYAHIHHRRLMSLSEMQGAYQRMLRSAKLRQIKRYVDAEDGFFPNSVIINFRLGVTWTSQRKVDSVEQGVLTLPPYYASAWVIDGQHRLYGAAQAKSQIMLPVLAFQGMNVPEQATLFVDINKKQTKVPAELLWDLYSDIYQGSSNARHCLLYIVAETAKRLAQRGPLKGRIQIPSLPKPGRPALKLATVCDTIRKYLHWRHIPHGDDPKRAPDDAGRLISAYYDELRNLWPEDWDRERSDVLLSNNGFGVLLMVFDDILRHLVNEGHDRILRQQALPKLKATLRDVYLKPLVEYLKHTEGFASRVRTANSRGLQDAAAAELDLQIAVNVHGFHAPRMQKQNVPLEPPAPRPSKGQRVTEKCKILEGLMRTHVLQKLKGEYGPGWWRQGVPGGAKSKADKRWQREVKKKPYLQHQAPPSDPNEYKFHKLGFEELRQVVTCRTNWDAIFEADFGDQATFEMYLLLVVPCRDAASHVREADEQDILNGAAGLWWFSKCLAERTINPYL